MEFDWDDGKRRSNLTKHGIEFGLVFPAFADSKRVIFEDLRKDYGEVRINMLAKLNARIYHITYTQRGTFTWLISARKANKREQKRYDKP